MNLQEEQELLRKIKKGDERAFEEVFHCYYQNLCVFAAKIIQDDTAAEEIVQDLFVKIWEKHNEIEIKSSLKNYLIRSTKNQCLNYIKHNKIKEKHAKIMFSEKESASTGRDDFIEIDLMEEIEKSINSLPKKRQEVFRLSREEGLKYREIAEKLGVSVKTVETQMGLAIKTLREKLKNYSTFLTLFYTFMKK
ncbi:MAG: RNA polymerase sigma-70 factor [Prolixibacteraceae bacterium]